MAYEGLYHVRMAAAKYRKILADNVAELMRATPELNSHAKVAAKATMWAIKSRKIGARTIGHLLDYERGPQPQLDTIVAVAKAFKVEPWMLLRDDFDAATGTVREADPEVLDLAGKIAHLEDDKRKLLMEIFASEGAPDPSQRPTLHDDSSQRYEARVSKEASPQRFHPKKR